MNPKGAEGIANSVDPDQTAPRSGLIWVCTDCPDLSVQKENYGISWGFGYLPQYQQPETPLSAREL